MAPQRPTNTQRLDALEHRIGGVDAIEERLHDIQENLRTIDIENLIERVKPLEEALRKTESLGPSVEEAEAKLEAIIERLSQIEQANHSPRHSTIETSVLNLSERVEILANRILALERREHHDPTADFEAGFGTLAERINALEHKDRSPRDSNSSPRVAAEPGMGDHLANRMQDLEENTHDAIDSLQRELLDIRSTVNVTVRAMGNQPMGPAPIEFGRPRVPEPKHFDGTRDAKELENFLFDME